MAWFAYSLAPLYDSSVTTVKINDGAVTNVKINSSAAIAYSKLAALTSANLLIGSAANVATVTAVTGDITISNAGVTAVGADKIIEAMVANDAIGLAELKAGTDGELITWDASGDPATVAVGTATHVLTSNGAGAAPTFQAAAGGTETLQNPIIIFPFMYEAVIQGTWGVQLLNTLIFYYRIQCETGINNELNYKVWIPSGTYVVHLVGCVESDAGIVHFLIDGVDKTTIDQYQAGAEVNKHLISASFSNATSGLKDFNMKMSSKNASSSNYVATYQLITLQRTGAA